MKKLALLMGAGDIARQLAPLLSTQDFEVIGARRHHNHPAVSFPMMYADARKAQDWSALLESKPSVIVVTLTPTEFSDKGYQTGYVEPVQAMLKALEGQAEKPFIVFVSSTSVYGERSGEWVSEETATEPTSFAGKRLLEAEQLLRDAKLAHVVVRFSGIYGPGREGMVARLISGEVKITPAWTNRIHSRDCAGVIAHLINMQQQGSNIDNLYLASDNEPVRQEDFVRWLTAKLGLDADSLPATDQVGPRGSKRCLNKRLQDTGYRFIYPSYKEGYEGL